MSLASRSLAALASGLLVTCGALVAIPAAPADAGGTTLCSGWKECVAAGYSDAGYGAASGSSYWKMFSGHNCTNYVAYRMIQGGMSATRPFAGTGNAWNWGVQMADKTDQTPSVGSVAWFNKGVSGAGSVGHVAYVEQVISPTEILVSEDSWGGTFHWRTITSDSGWPSGFIHLVDKPIVNTAPASIGGTAAVGQTLTANPGSWTPAATVGYQWFADGAPLAGATASTLKLSSGLGGKAVSLRVSASLAGYATGTSDTAAVPVSLGALAPVAAPAVEGLKKNAVVGTVLTAQQTTFAPAARRVGVQWYADGVPIPGATAWTYTLGAADVSKVVTAAVIGKRPGYAATPARSAEIGPVVAGRVAVEQAYAVTGRALVGRTMQLSGGAVSPADATAAYTWRRDGEAIDGATGPTYTLTPADAGSQLSVAMTIARDGWLSRKTVVERAAVVSTTSSLTVKTAGKRGQAVVWFRLTAPGVARPAGTAKVTIGAIERTITVRKGIGHLVLERLIPGKRAVTVSWLGTDTVLTSSATAKVKVK